NRRTCPGTTRRSAAWTPARSCIRTACQPSYGPPPRRGRPTGAGDIQRQDPSTPTASVLPSPNERLTHSWCSGVVSFRETAGEEASTDAPCRRGDRHEQQRRSQGNEQDGRVRLSAHQVGPRREEAAGQEQQRGRQAAGGEAEALLLRRLLAPQDRQAEREGDVDERK